MPELDWTYVWLCLAAFAAGAMNSVAGGGTLLTFPALTGVIAPAFANATSTVALLPGSFAGSLGYRKELRECRRFALRMLAPSLLGGFLGAWLVGNDTDTFDVLVPWLILTAAVLFVIQAPLARWLKIHKSDREPGATRQVALIGFQFLVAVYGGYFGAGIGILMLAALGLMGERDIHRMNALKNLAAVCINGVASVTFALGGKVQWLAALIVALGAIAGGYGGAGIAQKLGQKSVRALVTGIGVSITAWMFYQRLTG